MERGHRGMACSGVHSGSHGNSTEDVQALLEEDGCEGGLEPGLEGLSVPCSAV